MTDRAAWGHLAVSTAVTVLSAGLLRWGLRHVLKAAT